MTDSRKYLEAVIRQKAAPGTAQDGNPMPEEMAEIVMAMVSDLPFDSFSEEDGALKCYIQEDLFDKGQLEAALEEIPCLEYSLEVNRIAGANWNSEWESTFESVRVGTDVEVRSPYAAGSGARHEIIISPEMAFGTGSHATTRMMMEWMVRLEPSFQGAAVYDIGCGSGVLAILAAKMGAAFVTAVDTDATAADSAASNALRNNLDINILCTDASALDGNRCDIILANIHKNIIISELPRFARSLRKGGRALLSGFFTGDAPDVIAAARECGLSPEGSIDEEGWCSLCVRHP